MVKFILVRHGFSQYNNEKRFTGQTDVPLDESGLLQANDTSEYILKNFQIDCIYSSDLSRAIQTVRLVSETLKLPIYKRPELRELFLGNWEGESMDLLAKKYGEDYRDYIYDPKPIHGGESYAVLMKRAKKIIEEIASENEGKTVLVSSHGGFLRALLCVWYEMKPSELKNVTTIPNSSVSVVNINDGKPEFVYIGYDKHLKVKKNLV